MVTKISVDIPICDKKAFITAMKISTNKINILIESDCNQIKRLGQNFKEITMKDACLSFDENPVFMLSKKYGVTTTCLVPCAIINAVWVEAGLISKNLLEDERMKELKFKFV